MRPDSALCRTASWLGRSSPAPRYPPNDRISQYRPNLGIIPSKMDDCPWRSIAIGPVFLQMRCLYDLHRRVLGKCSQCRKLGGFSPPTPPRRFQHSGSALPFLVDSLTHIIIPTGGYEPG